MEARGGLEPPNRGFADLSLSLLGTAPWRHNRSTRPARQLELNAVMAEVNAVRLENRWGDRRGPQTYQASGGPLLRVL